MSLSRRSQERMWRANNTRKYYSQDDIIRIREPKNIDKRGKVYAVFEFVVIEEVYVRRTDVCTLADAQPQYEAIKKEFPYREFTIMTERAALEASFARLG